VAIGDLIPTASAGLLSLPVYKIGPRYEDRYPRISQFTSSLLIIQRRPEIMVSRVHETA
jgi:hypothetical protein